MEFINETVNCLNDIYNQNLVATGQAKNIQEAQSMSRHISCKCPKCTTKA